MTGEDNMSELNDGYWVSTLYQGGWGQRCRSYSFKRSIIASFNVSARKWCESV